MIPSWLNFDLIDYVKLWFYTHWGYVLIVHAVELYRAGKLGFYWKWIGGLYYAAAIFGALDGMFNMVFGTIIFAERPKELLFTSRVQRHVDESSGYRKRIAIRFGKILNVIHAVHVKLPAPRPAPSKKNANKKK